MVVTGEGAALSILIILALLGIIRECSEWSYLTRR